MRLLPILCPSSCSVSASNAGRNQVAPKPKATQAIANQLMPTSMERGASWALRDPALRGRARNVIANAFTKQAAAKAPVNASMEPASGNRIRVKPPVAPNPARRLWYVSHSLTNPFNGGRPEMATAPIRKQKAVTGMGRINPPNSSMFRVPVECSTDPAPRNKRHLKMA